MTLLLREAIGGSLRRARTARHRTLRDVSGAARVSLGYLSEVERGRKEASSELLAAICEALDLPLPELLDDASRTLTHTGVDGVEVAPVPAGRPLEGGRLVMAARGGEQAELRLALSRPLPAALAGRAPDARTDRLAAGIVVAA